MIKMTEENKDKDLEEILVYGAPYSDAEAFANLVTGTKPDTKPARMKLGDYKLAKRIGWFSIITGLALYGALVYSDIKEGIEKHGSYKQYIENVRKTPSCIF